MITIIADVRGPLLEKDPASVLLPKVQKRVEMSGALLMGRIKLFTPVAFGILRGSVTLDIKPLVATVQSGLIYAVPVEGGGAAHWPPARPIELWVQRKFKISDARALKTTAYFVRRAIAARGTAAYQMFHHGMQMSLSTIRGFFAEIGVEITSEYS